MKNKQLNYYETKLGNASLGFFIFTVTWDFQIFFEI